MHVPDYPINLELNNPLRNTGDRVVRETSTIQWKENAKYKNSRESFCIDTGKLWNQAPMDIKNAESISIAKTKIKTYCRSLVI